MRRMAMASPLSAATDERADLARTARPPSPWLRGERLHLREFCANDLGDLMRMHADPRLRAHLLDDQPLDRGITALQFLVNISHFYRAREGLGIWHASSAQVGAGAARFVGWFNLMPLPSRGEDAVELGSRLVPEAWGGALAMEGGELLLDHAVDRLGLTRVWATCDPANRSARACLAALGFSERGEDDYDGRLGLYAAIEADHWRAWRRLSRRERLRAARTRRQRDGQPGDEESCA